MFKGPTSNPGHTTWVTALVCRPLWTPSPRRPPKTLLPVIPFAHGVLPSREHFISQTHTRLLVKGEPRQNQTSTARENSPVSPAQRRGFHGQARGAETLLLRHSLNCTFYRKFYSTYNIFQQKGNIQEELVYTAATGTNKRYWARMEMRVIC